MYTGFSLVRVTINWSSQFNRKFVDETWDFGALVGPFSLGPLCSDRIKELGEDPSRAKRPQVYGCGLVVWTKTRGKGGARVHTDRSEMFEKIIPFDQNT